MNAWSVAVDEIFPTNPDPISFETLARAAER